MIIIAGSIDLVDPADRDTCVAQSVALQQATREDEPGCLAYAFSADSVVAHRIQVLEIWADEASLAAHFVHPNFSAMKTMLSHFRRGPSSVLKHRVDLSEPVYDSERQPRADFLTTVTRSNDPIRK